MTKRTLIGLIALMVLSLIAIIWVQITWIGNSIKVRNEQFDFFVINSLRNTAQSMESSRRLSFLNEMFLRGYSQAPRLQTYSPVQNSYSSRVTFESSSSPDKDSVEIVVATNNNPPVRMKVPRNEANKTIEQSVVVNSDEYMRWAQQQAGAFQSMSNQLVSEMYDWEKDLHISKEELLHTLQGEFKASGIETPFEFAIIRADSLGDGIYSKVKLKEFAESPYKVNLFSDGLVRKGETLSVVSHAKQTMFLAQWD
jgi:hypothetical protein